MEEKKIQLKVHGLSNSQIQSGAYALVLSEEGPRRVPVFVGMFEAQSIAIAIEGIETPRPLTHDLFISLAQAAGYNIVEVFINRFHDGVFFSEIVLQDATGAELRIDSRTSDAIAIAIRVNCHIFSTEEIVRKCGIVIDEELLADEESAPIPDNITLEDLKDVKKLRSKLKELSQTDIEERISEAVEKEEYEFAKAFKDELLRREKRKKKE
jgi:bifunctional DNase/RNase